MKTRVSSHTLSSLVLLLIGILFVASCGSIADTPATETSQPLSTPEVAESSSTQPEVTPVSPAVAAIRTATANTAALETYRLDFQVTDRTEGVDLVLFDAAFRGLDAQYTFNTPDIEAGGLDPAIGMQVIAVDGTTYAHGPIPMAGTDDAVWYNLGANPPSAVQQPPLDLPLLLDALLNDGVDMAAFEATGQETLGGQECTRYTAGELPALNALNGLGVSETGKEQPVEEQIEDMNLEQTDITMLICADTYLHDLNIQMRGSPAEMPAEIFDIEVVLRVSDINGKIRIAAPDNAIAPQS